MISIEYNSDKSTEPFVRNSINGEDEDVIRQETPEIQTQTRLPFKEKDRYMTPIQKP
jgi:hypothetical protein